MSDAPGRDVPEGSAVELAKTEGAAGIAAGAGAGASEGATGAPTEAGARAGEGQEGPAAPTPEPPNYVGRLVAKDFDGTVSTRGGVPQARIHA